MHFVLSHLVIVDCSSVFLSLKFASSVQSQVGLFPCMCWHHVHSFCVHEKAMVFCLLLLQLIAHLGNFKNYPLFDLNSVASPTQLEYVKSLTSFVWLSLNGLPWSLVLMFFVHISWYILELLNVVHWVLKGVKSILIY